MLLLYFFVLIWSKIIFYRQIVYLDWWIFSNKLNIDCILQLCSLYNILTYLMVSVYLSVNITMILGGNDFWVIKGLYEDCSDFFFKWRRLLFSYNNTSSIISVKCHTVHSAIYHSVKVTYPKPIIYI